MADIWGCAWCGEEFDYKNGYKTETGTVICPECKSDDTHFHKDTDKEDDNE